MLIDRVFFVRVAPRCFGCGAVNFLSTLRIQKVFISRTLNDTRKVLDIPPAEVAAALGERRVAVSTSRPTPQEFAQAYRESGASHVVSLHLSSALSGTVDSARLGAAQVLADGISVKVVDTAAIAMGLGHLTGTLEIGKSADLVVLDQNLFEVPPERLSHTKVLSTFFEGRLVHQRA